MARDSFTDFVLDQLADVGRVTARSMFGGHGLYQQDIFFGIIHKGRLYFKTDEASRPDYRELGMRPFKPSAKQTLTTYYEVPVDIVEDREQLTAWAERASRIKPKARPRRR